MMEVLGVWCRRGRLGDVGRRLVVVEEGGGCGDVFFFIRRWWKRKSWGVGVRIVMVGFVGV